MESIQVMRAIAAIAVVFVHIPVLAKNGTWGVDLFFVISGFIMCHVTEQSSDHFFIKRLIRVVPLYWAGTIGLFVLACVAPNLLQNTTANLIHLFKSLAFIPFRKGVAVQPVMFLGWTLNYEILFYCLFAISIKLSHRYRAVICSGFILALVVYGEMAQPDTIPIRFWTSSITIEFILGMVCYYAYRATGISHTREIFNPSRIGWYLAGAMALACLPLATYLAEYNRVLKYGVAATLSLYFVLCGLSGIRLPGSMVLLGDASYSLYMFHPYIIQTLYRGFDVFLGAGWFRYFMAGTTVMVCCIMSVLSYRYFEKPVTDFLRSHLTVAPDSGR